MLLTMTARRFQRTHLLRGMGSSLNAPKDIGIGVMCAAVVGSVRAGRVPNAGSDREDRSSDVCYVGDTRQSFSEKDNASILHTHHLC